MLPPPEICWLGMHFGAYIEHIVNWKGVEPCMAHHRLGINVGFRIFRKGCQRLLIPLFYFLGTVAQNFLTGKYRTQGCTQQEERVKKAAARLSLVRRIRK